jgi:hypothetical protein
VFIVSLADGFNVYLNVPFMVSKNISSILSYIFTTDNNLERLIKSENDKTFLYLDREIIFFKCLFNANILRKRDSHEYLKYS